MKIIRLFKNSSLHTKLAFMFIFMASMIFLVNLYIYSNLNRMIERIDEVYAGNIVLNEMTESLTSIQSNVEEYLKTKNSDALEQYFKNEQTFSNQLKELNDNPGSSNREHLESMVKKLSETYLEVVEDTVQAKRGRNVEKYSEGYEESTKIYGYINAYITSLNNERFKDSSQNYEMLNSSLKVAEFLSLSIILAISVTSFFFIIILTRSITSPLISLAKRADEVSEGDFDGELLTVKSEDEIGVVTNAFNHMLLSIREYVQQIKANADIESAHREKELRMEAHLKDAQLKYLQAQINPHFLFNTLNAGAQLAMLEGAEKTNRYIQTMADFFRYNVRKNNEDVTLAEEIELIDNYIYIINVRFSGDVHFEKHIDQELLNIKAPSMILQPIVENSVNYGIRDIDWDGYITLSLYREGNDACLCVDDNGVGIPKETIDRILSRDIKPSELSKDSNGVGLANVITRLEMYYDKENIFDIESDGENLGTRVTIRIPIEPDNRIGEEHV